MRLRDEGVLIQIYHGMVRKWFGMGIFRVLGPMHCNPILDILAIARLVKVGWDASEVEWFHFNYERPKFIFIPPVSGVTPKRADGTK